MALFPSRGQARDALCLRRCTVPGSIMFAKIMDKWMKAIIVLIMVLCIVVFRDGSGILQKWRLQKSLNQICFTCHKDE
jgi:hypothetical protein